MFTSLLVPESTPILDAMRLLNDNGKRILFVVDGKKLKAALSDGDIRRWLLGKGSLDAPVSELANYAPKSLPASRRREARAFMEQHGIDALPLVEADGTVADIVFLRDLPAEQPAAPQPTLQQVPVVIMAGGKGTRLYPYTEVLPKPLIPIGEKTITEHILNRFEQFGCHRFSMIVNYKKELIKAFFRDSQHAMSFYDETEFLGTAGGLRLLCGDMADTFFLSNCDIVLEADYADIYRHHKEQGNLITLVCATKQEVIPYGTVHIREDGQVERFAEKPSFEFLINTGFYVIEPAFLECIPADTFVHITDVIQRCMDNGQRVGVYTVPSDAWMDMGQLDEMKKMRERLGVK